MLVISEVEDSYFFKNVFCVSISTLHSLAYKSTNRIASFSIVLHILTDTSHKRTNTLYFFRLTCNTKIQIKEEMGVLFIHLFIFFQHLFIFYKKRLIFCFSPIKILFSLRRGYVPCSLFALLPPLPFQR